MQDLSAPISSLSLPLVQTQAVRWKAAAPKQLTGGHLYVDIAKSGYIFHGFSCGMYSVNKFVTTLLQGDKACNN